MSDVLRECIGKRVKCGEDSGWVIGLAKGTYSPIVRFDSGAKEEVPRFVLTVIAMQEGE